MCRGECTFAHTEINWSRTGDKIINARKRLISTGINFFYFNQKIYLIPYVDVSCNLRNVATEKISNSFLLREQD